MKEQLLASARATLETSSKLPTSRQKGVGEDLRSLLEQCAQSGAQTQSASLETSIISQNQKSDRNPYSLAAFQCYWVPSLPHHSSGRQELPTGSCRLREEAPRLKS